METYAPIVRYQKVSKSFGNVHVLKEINLVIAQGEKVAIIGPSGSGKTTLARLLMTLEAPSSGTIYVNEELLWHKEVRGKLVTADEKHLHRVRSQIGFVFQHFNLFPHMTIQKNLTIGLTQVLGMDKKAANQRAIEMLDKVGLSGKEDAYPIQLSGGQKQRVAISRAIVMRPKIMLFDEVTSALDPELVGEVLTVIRELAKEETMAMLLITHEMEFAREIADRILFIDEGYIVEQGTPQQIFINPQSPRLKLFLNRFHKQNSELG